MGYLIGEILVCLILAALIGAIIALLLRGVRCRAREKELLDDLKKTHSKLDGAEGELRRQSASLSDLRGGFEAQTEELNNRVDELSTAEATLEKRQTTIARLESELVQLRGEKEVEIASLREHIGALEPLQGRLNELQAERNRLQGELQAELQQRQGAEERLEHQLEALTRSKDEEIARLRGQLEDRTAELGGIAEQLAASRAEVERRGGELHALRTAGQHEGLTHQRQPADGEVRAKVSRNLSAGPLYEAPAEKDDLKKIWGIGSVLEKTLNQLGITTFAQIGRFTAEDIERVSRALDVFPGRIVRDGWVEGAASAYQKKYGKKLD